MTTDSLSQWGATPDGDKTLKKLTGVSSAEDDEANSEKSADATFQHEYQAYMFALSLGLASGKKKSGIFTPKFQEGQVSRSGRYDLKELIYSLGDVSDDGNWVAAANEYANWGLSQIQGSQMPSGEFKLARLITSNDEQPGNGEPETEESGAEKSEKGGEAGGDEGPLIWPPKDLSPGDWKKPTWLIEGKLAGAERPGRKGSGDTSQVEKSEVDEWIQAAKDLDPPIKSIICLLDDDQLDLYKCVEEQGGLIEYYRSNDIWAFEVENESVKHPDDGKKLPDDKITAASEAYGKLPDPVVVHCSAAQGRTRDAINDGILPDHFND